jgi:hypothetical protein
VRHHELVTALGMLSWHVHLIGLKMSDFGMDFSLIVAPKKSSRSCVLEAVVAVLFDAIPGVARLWRVVAVFEKDLLVFVGDAHACARLHNHVDVARPGYDRRPAIPEATVIHDREEGKTRGCWSVAGRGLLRYGVAFVIAGAHALNLLNEIEPDGTCFVCDVRDGDCSVSRPLMACWCGTPQLV